METISFFLLIALLIVQVIGGIIVYLIFSMARSKSINLRQTVYYPLLVAGVLFTMTVLMEVLEEFIPYGSELESVFMLSVALVMFYGLYTYYKNIKKLP